MKREEDILQIACYTYFHNNYPLLRGLLNYNLNNSANAKQGAQNKRMGLQPSRPDLVFYYKSKAHHAELKIPGQNPRPNQTKFHKLLSQHGFQTEIIRTLAEFKSWVHGIVGDAK